jgi:hypothetical protein
MRVGGKTPGWHRGTLKMNYPMDRPISPSILGLAGHFIAAAAAAFCAKTPNLA